MINAHLRDQKNQYPQIDPVCKAVKPVIHNEIGTRPSYYVGDYYNPQKIP